jgi:ABC-type transport system involved in multi-copper enzyme maturation permease subunit
MFITLLIVGFGISLAVCAFVVRIFAMPINDILKRIIADEISLAWAKYLRFAMYVAGISSGVQIWNLERYVNPGPGQHAEVIPLTADRWILEVYRTIIDTLQGLAWVLLVFFVIALIAYVIVRTFESKRPKTSAESEHLDQGPEK